MRSVASRTHLPVALVSVLALVALGCVVSSAGAAEPKPWGEFEAFKPLRLTEEARKLTKSLRAPKFAAAPNGTYYVLRQGEFIGKFILQRFRENELQAETPEFEPPRVSKAEEEEEAAEGANAALAVSPDGERVYVLSVYNRRGSTTGEEGNGQFPLDSEMPAAGSLYAFEYNGKELVSAKTEEVKKKQVPAPALDREAMHSEAEEKHATKSEPNPPGLEPAERPLLDPRGMAVDPATGDLVISGNEDEAPMERVQKGEEEKQCRAALQFVSVKTGGSGMELSLGARYVDKQAKVLFGKPLTHESESGCGEAEEEGRGVEQAPAAPVFAPDGSVLGYSEDDLEELGLAPPLEYEGVIWQLTPSLSQTQEQAPGVLEMSPNELFVAEAVEPFAAYTGGEQPASVMSLVPESSTDGTIYLSGLYDFNFEHEPAPAVLHYSHPSVGEPSITEVGWIGGAKENEHLGTAPCNLHAYPESDGPTMLGGLSGGGLLALAFYEEEGADHQKEEAKFYAEVLRFGEGGSTAGCPQAPVTTPTQSYRGEITHKVAVGAELTITSGFELKEFEPAAAARSVTWVVKLDGASEPSYETTYTYEKELPSQLTFQHTFVKAGTYEITDVVHTDDLADEIAEPAEADKLTVTSSKLIVKPGTPEPPEVRAHEQEATLKAVAEVPGEPKLHIEKIVWSFGDGTKMESGAQELASPATLEAKHAFNRCGSLKVTTCKVQVTVYAHSEVAENQPAGEIKVEESTKEEEEEEGGSGSGGGGGGSGGGGSGSGGGGSGNTGGGGGSGGGTQTSQAKGAVQAYIASFSGSSLSVSSGGAVAVTIACPSGGACGGTLTLQTLNAVAATAASHRAHGKASKKKAKKKILTLASGSFSLTGGSRSVILHLSAAAKALLHRSHGVLHAKLTILSRGVGGQQNNTTTHVVTLRLAKPHKKSHKVRHKH
jgi:hypothetical protein